MNKEKPILDIVIPVYNEEEDTLLELIKRLKLALHNKVASYRILFVNDGSIPLCTQALERLAEEYPELYIVHLSRNFGHQAAISAGMAMADGDAVVLMDGDLQDSPDVLPEFLEKWRQGAEVVYAIRKQRKESFIKRGCYHLFYRVLKIFSEIEIPLDAGDFCLMDQKAVKAIRNMPETLRFVRGLRSWVGFRQTGVPVERAGRFGGTSKYSLRKLLNLAFDGIFSFTVRPLRCIILIGIGMMMTTLCYGGYKLYQKLVNQQPIPGWTSLMLMSIFNTSLIVVLLGIIGEYLARTYMEIKKRPPYIISRTTEKESTKEKKN